MGQGNAAGGVVHKMVLAERWTPEDKNLNNLIRLWEEISEILYLYLSYNYQLAVLIYIMSLLIIMMADGVLLGIPDLVFQF